MQVLPAQEPALISDDIVSASIRGVQYSPLGLRLPSDAVFEPKIHMCYQAPARQYSFSDLGLDTKGIHPVAITEAFPLFTREAVVELRKDCLSTKVHEDFSHSWELAALQAREFHPKIAPFTCAAFSSPEFIAACSAAAGIELVVIMPLELGHTNYQVGPGGKEAVRALPAEPSKPLPPISDVPADDGEQVVGWHYDAYPFVAVTMLSDVTNIVGGETGIQLGDGSIAKIRGPEMGWTVVMQGRYVRHLACKAYNAAERITMVTSFRAKDVSLPDESILPTIRPITKKNRINAQWSIYRLRLVAERLEKLAAQIEGDSKDDIDAEEEVCTKGTMQSFVDDQAKYLQHGIDEMM